MCDVLEFVVHLGEQMITGSLSSQQDKLLSSGGGRGRGRRKGRNQRWSSTSFPLWKESRQCYWLSYVMETRNLASALMRWSPWMTLTMFFYCLWTDTLNCHWNFHSLSVEIYQDSNELEEYNSNQQTMVVQSMANAFIVYSWARHYLSDVSLPTQLCRQSSLRNGHLGDGGKSVFMTVRESIYDCTDVNCLINLAYVRISLPDVIFTMHFNIGRNRTGSQATWSSHLCLTLILNTARYGFHWTFCYCVKLSFLI